MSPLKSIVLEEELKAIREYVGHGRNSKEYVHFIGR
jgi:hypothetical protein